MLLEAILGIIAISIVFCCCTFCCYILFQFLLEEEKADVQPEPEPWEAKHYYDPLPLSTPSPPDTIFKPTPYTFKLQNGNGIYAAAPLSQTMPHAVINPAVLQYPPGHVLDQQHIPPKNPAHPPRENKANETKQRNPASTRRRRSRSRSPIPNPNPNPRGAKNVWSTNMEFQPTHHNYNHHQQQQPQPHQQHRSHQHPPQQQQPYPQTERQYVQLTQEHYPVVQPRHPTHFPPEEFSLRESNPHQHTRQHQQQHLPEAQYEAFLASSHATNIVYNQHNNSQHNQQHQYDNGGYHHHDHDYDEHPKHHKHSRSHRSRHKEAVT